VTQQLHDQRLTYLFTKDRTIKSICGKRHLIFSIMIRLYYLRRDTSSIMFIGMGRLEGKDSKISYPEIILSKVDSSLYTIHDL